MTGWVTYSSGKTDFQPRYHFVTSSKLGIFPSQVHNTCNQRWKNDFSNRGTMYRIEIISVQENTQFNGSVEIKYIFHDIAVTHWKMVLTICMLGNINFADSAAPDNHGHLYSLSRKLHCLLICKIGLH